MIKQIAVTDLEVGMYISSASNSWIPGQNRRQEGFIRSEETVTQVQCLGVPNVFIDTEKGKDSPKAKPIEQDFNEAIAVVAKVHGEAKNLVGNLLDSTKVGGELDIKGAEKTSNQMVAALKVNTDAMLCMGRIRHKDEYLLEHSVNVATLMGILANHLGFDDDLQHQLVMGGLLHDVGKIMVPDEILHKPGKLEAEEWDEMKRHVEYGQQTLERTPDLSPIVKSICGLHHERLDGSGYPAGLSAEEITVYGRMASIVDVYDAVTADRVYHKGMAPTDALRKLVEWSGDHLDKELVYQFIRAISVYPSGSVVQLDNGLVGYVCEGNRKNPDRPMIDVFYDASKKQPITRDRIDLGSGFTERKIVKAVDEKEFGIRLDDVVVPNPWPKD